MTAIIQDANERPPRVQVGADFEEPERARADEWIYDFEATFENGTKKRYCWAIITPHFRPDEAKRLFKKRLEENKVVRCRVYECRNAMDSAMVEAINEFNERLRKERENRN